VQPMLVASCASCHEGTVGSTPYKFLGAIDPSDNYQAIMTDQAVIGGWNPALATLLTKGAHDGRAWTDPEKATISAWMAQEVIDRNVDLENPPPPQPAGPLTARQALAQWSACMQYADWTDSQVYTWANKGTNQGPCRQCHTDGAGAFFANTDADMMFEMNKHEVFIKAMFTVAPKSLTDPSLGYEVRVNDVKLCNKGAGDGQSHPNYNCAGTQMDRLVDFYTRTKTYIESGACTATPGFPATP